MGIGREALRRQYGRLIALRDAPAPGNRRRFLSRLSRGFSKGIQGGVGAPCSRLCRVPATEVCGRPTGRPASRKRARSGSQFRVQAGVRFGGLETL